MKSATRRFPAAVKRYVQTNIHPVKCGSTCSNGVKAISDRSFSACVNNFDCRMYSSTTSHGNTAQKQSLL